MIRQMTDDDIDACMNIESIRFDAPERWSRESFEKHLHEGKIALVKTVEGAVTGFVVAEQEPEGLHIRNIAVSADKQGWGTELLNSVLPKSGRVDLQVKRGTAALGFYSAKQFQQVGETPGYLYLRLEK